jgi:anaerobic selenocysteine-containing dehydrogenase
MEVLKDESLLPFTVAVSPFYDESSSLADMILPDATYLERWDWEDMVSPAQISEYYIRQPMVKPLGEVRDFADVCCELAERMGFPLGVKNKEEFVQKSCEMTKAVKKAGGFEYMKKHGVYHDPNAKPAYFTYSAEVSADKLTKEGVLLDEETGVYWNWAKSGAKSEDEARAKGYTHTKKSYKGYVAQQFGNMVYRGFPPDKVNKTGYFEIYSQIMAEAGLDPLPTYHPIPEHASMGDDQVILTTFKVNVQSHSRTQNCKWLTEIYHENPAWINPATAAAKGIEDGDMVKVASGLGEIEIRARVTPAVVPGVVAVSFHCGHWEYGRYASGNEFKFGEAMADAESSRMWWKGNHGVHPNWLIPNSPDPISGQLRWMDTVVSLSKA